MSSIFTKQSIHEMLRQWPLAVSMDEGDLKTMHEACCAGAQRRGQIERLRWPDFLWFDLEEQGHGLDRVDNVQIFNARATDPRGTGEIATFSGVRGDACMRFPADGRHAISNRVTAIIEVKTIEARFERGLFTAGSKDKSWRKLLRNRLSHFFSKMADANDQIGGAKRILGCSEARGVVIVLNSRSPNLPDEIASPYLRDVIKALSFTDAVLYLRNPSNRHKPRPIMIWKKDDDPVLQRFVAQSEMMLRSFVVEKGSVVCRLGRQPHLLMQIEMDEYNWEMCRSWSTGWRRVDDPTPIPALSMKATLVQKPDFKPGLPPSIQHGCRART
jgi:hypothetical protein